MGRPSGRVQGLTAGGGGMRAGGMGTWWDPRRGDGQAAGGGGVGVAGGRAQRVWDLQAFLVILAAGAVPAREGQWGQSAPHSSRLLICF